MRTGGADDSFPRRDQLRKAASELDLGSRQSPASEPSDWFLLPLPALETACVEGNSVS